MCIYTDIHMFIIIHAYLHTCMHDIHTDRQTDTQTDRHTDSYVCLLIHINPSCRCTYECVYTGTCVYVYLYTYTCVSMHIAATISQHNARVGHNYDPLVRVLTQQLNLLRPPVFEFKVCTWLLFPAATHADPCQTV